ncbi:hypothetical protein LTR37_013281 [Vermiconidia calcicola]|uniref:Uncharacterized protein n=1 Tax=Vermiconidia calcicola TaxID=1690605 RepID=A0ACC3MWT7_9PEZI|nr:hypothetical protein LTR37_013281 [Vermiconidia calcicola]
MARITFLAFAAVAAAQNLTQSIAPSAIVNGTPTQNPALLASPFVMNVEDMWNMLVGPVTKAYYTTTISATPVPSSSLVPPPPIHYPRFPNGQQVPMESKNESWSFPRDFWWGVAGAAYQVEGAAKADGRGPSVWDVLAHRVTGFVTDSSTADVTNNNYYMYKDDIARIAALGVKTYSFSLSWSRIFPFGRGAVNEVAIAHYNDIIDTCIQHDVIPMVTLYHWDTPLALQDTYGGWLSENIVNDFVEYARVVYGRFGDRVKYWFTLNEPIVFCQQYPLPANYFKNFTVPNEQQSFHCGQSVLLAHSKAYRLGKSMMPNSNGGYKIPLTDSEEDARAVQRAWDFNEGWFSDPVYLTGDYNSAVKNYVSTFLRPFTESEKQAIKGSGDLYAHDAYTSQFYYAPEGGVDACVNDPSHPSYPVCADTQYTYKKGWLIGPAADPLAPWLHKATDWVPQFLRYMKDTWADPAGNLPIAVTEFGFAEPYEAQKTLLKDILYDPIRVSYYRDYMEAILMAMSEGVNVVGCLAWSLYDNFEEQWASGFAVRFGMQYVDFTDPQLPRYYKASFFEYKRAFDVYQER